MNESPIEVRPRVLSDVISEMGRGVLRIPRFQRDYVWESTRVAKLFDSIYKGFPIGSFFYWITPQEYKDHYRDIPELNLPKPETYDQIKMILDGQQRLTSLFVTAKGLSLSAKSGSKKKDYKKICFDLDTEKFESVKQKEDKQRIISVYRFFDPKGEAEIYDKLTPERRIMFRKCKDILNSYPISIVEVKGKLLDDAIEIFERINQGGKRLGLFDLVVASTWSEEFDLKEKTKELNDKLSDSGFGKIDEEVVTQTVALVVKGGCTKSYQLQLTREEIISNWKLVSEGIMAAIDFLRSDLGVRVYEFIPYPPMIAMTAYLYTKIPNRSLTTFQVKFIKDWFWKTAFSQRYGSSTLTTMGSDIVNYFNPIIEGKQVSLDIPITLRIEDISGLMIYARSAIKSAILCLLALQQPRHFRTGTPIVLDSQLCSDYNRSQKHHIFPKAFLKRANIKHCDLLINFALIPGELNREISDREPAEYLTEYKASNSDLDAIMASHFINVAKDAAIWSNDFESFIQERAEIIFRHIEALTGDSMLEVNMNTEPTKVVDELEKILRMYIDDKLRLDQGENYWKQIPSDIQDRVKRKMEERHKRHPYEDGTLMSDLERLSFCDVMDYNNIICKNWNIFGGDFGSTGETQKHFLNIKEYRNSLMHGRKMNRIDKKQGEASVEWLMQVINSDEEDLTTTE